MVRDHLLSLDRSDLYLRFLGYVNDDLVVVYSETIFAKGAIVLGELRPRATAWSSVGEVAITAPASRNLD